MRLIVLKRWMFSVFMCVYIPLQLRSEREKQIPVIETSPQISMVPVRTRRLVPVCWCVGMCLCMLMWARVTLLLRWIPAIPVPVDCMQVWCESQCSFKSCYFYPLTLTWIDVALSNILCLSFMLNWTMQWKNKYTLKYQYTWENLQVCFVPQCITETEKTFCMQTKNPLCVFLIYTVPH